MMQSVLLLLQLPGLPFGFHSLTLSSHERNPPNILALVQPHLDPTWHFPRCILTEGAFALSGLLPSMLNIALLHLDYLPPVLGLCSDSLG